MRLNEVKVGEPITLQQAKKFYEYGYTDIVANGNGKTIVIPAWHREESQKEIERTIDKNGKIRVKSNKYDLKDFNDLLDDLKKELGDDITFTTQSPETNKTRKNEISDEDIERVTGVAYKLFDSKDGKLYPPMVENVDNIPTPIGKWIKCGAEEFVEIADSMGKPQVNGRKGKKLAYRPGWHLGELPYAPQFASEDDPEYFSKERINPVWAKCLYNATIDYNERAYSYGFSKEGKFNHSLAGLPYPPDNGSYKYRTNPNPNTIAWIITGEIKVVEVLEDKEVERICKENGVPYMKRRGGEKTLKELGFNESLQEDLKRSEMKEDKKTNNVSKKDVEVKVDSLGNELSDKQVEFFKNSKVRNKKGELLVVYHGTEAKGLEIFDANNQAGYKFEGDYVNFFTNREDVAQTYVYDKSKDGEIYTCYLNIEHPYYVKNRVQDKEERTWSTIKDKKTRKMREDLAEKFLDNWMGVEVTKDDLKDVNKDLKHFGMKIVPAIEEDNHINNIFKSEDENLYNVHRDNKVISELSLMTLDELFGLEPNKDNVYSDNAWLMALEGYTMKDENGDWAGQTTNDIVRCILYGNEYKEFKNGDYDGIIIRNVKDSANGDLSIPNSNIYITLKSPNQIKRIDNKEPTLDNNINEELLNEHITALDRYEGIYATYNPKDVMDYIDKIADVDYEVLRILYDKNLDIYFFTTSRYSIHNDMVKLAYNRGYYDKIASVIDMDFIRNNYSRPYDDSYYGSYVRYAQEHGDLCYLKFVPEGGYYYLGDDGYDIVWYTKIGNFYEDSRIDFRFYECPLFKYVKPLLLGAEDWENGRIDVKDINPEILGDTKDEVEGEIEDTSYTYTDLDVEDEEEEDDDLDGIYIYQFPELEDESLDALEDYDLEWIGHIGEDNCVKGTKENLIAYGEYWIGGYGLVPGYLWKEKDFDYSKLDESLNEPFKESLEDKQGTIKAYHGSQQSDLQLSEEPIYLTNDLGIAEQFAMGYAFNFDLLDSDDPTVYEIEVNMNNPLYIKTEDEYDTLMDITNIENTKKYLDENNYDGIIYQDEEYEPDTIYYMPLNAKKQCKIVDKVVVDLIPQTDDAEVEAQQLSTYEAFMNLKGEDDEY